MTSKQLRELDNWIYQNVFNYSAPRKVFYKDGRKTVGINFLNDSTSVGIPRYSSDHAAAMEVLKKCAKKETIGISQLATGKWRVFGQDEEETIAETIELAICLFAKKLFTK